MREVRLAQEQITIVDDEDYEEINKHKWWWCHGYACRTTSKNYGLFMHRVILGLSKGDGKHSDHINGNKLDNRKSNLRICTRSENMKNSKIQSNNTSGFKGVNLKKSTGKWGAQIMSNGRVIHLGYHNDKIMAAKIYNEAALKYHKEFARLNEIPEWEQKCF
jgi:hypothetical protein